MGRDNEQTRQILRQAWGLACFLGHSCVGTEHLLIAIALMPTSAAYRAGAFPERKACRRGCCGGRKPHHP